MSEPAPKRRLPRRDWVLLPLIAAASGLLLVGAGEGGARVFWTESNAQPCRVDTVHNKANCVERVKKAEGPWVEDRYNECGYRSTGPCRAPAPNGRIVAIGSSSSWGYMVEFDKVWSVQAARQIERACGAMPDVQGLGGFGDLNAAARRLPEVIELKPQVVALMVAPFDLFKMPEAGFDPNPPAANAPKPAPEAQPKLDAIAQIKAVGSNLRAMTVVQHYLYQDPARYSSIYLNYGDKADFLRPPFTKAWQERMAYVDEAVGYIAQRLNEAHIPFVLVFVPQQGQADIIGSELSYPGVDAMALNRTIGEIAARHGAMFVDGADAFHGIKNAPAYFYSADGHINAKGSQVMGDAFARSVLENRVPGLCRSEQP